VRTGFAHAATSATIDGMDFLAWVGLAILYFVLLVVLGFRALNRGHTILFWLGLFVPLLWVIGAVMPPTNAASTANARARLH
jgi:hypothetical protein